MNVQCFHHILETITPRICRKDTNMREAISAGAKLEATLKFLGTEESYSSLRFSTRISASSLSLIIPEVCDAVVDSFEGEYLKVRK